MSSGVSSNWKLPQELIALSNGTQWPGVLKEWVLDYVDMLGTDEDLETCLCHHHPIREVCHIVNTENENTAIVGNCCVKKFGATSQVAGTHKIFDALKRIRKDSDKSANEELIEYALENEIINKTDHKFYINNWRARNLTEKQAKYKNGLNKKIIKHISEGGERKRANLLEATKSIPLPDAFSKLQKAPTNLANRKLIDHAHKEGVIDDWSNDFYDSIFKKKVRNPSEKQQACINKINEKILKSFKVSKS